jgi:hypothetical protein
MEKMSLSYENADEFSTVMLSEEEFPGMEKALEK